MRCTGRFHNKQDGMKTPEGRLICVECKDEIE